MASAGGCVCSSRSARARIRFRSPSDVCPMVRPLSLRPGRARSVRHHPQRPASSRVARRLDELGHPSELRNVIRTALPAPNPKVRAARDGRPVVPSTRSSGVELPGSAWGRSGDDPGPFDRCLQPTIVVSKNERPRSSRCTPRRIPHATRELSVHADELALASRQAIFGVLSTPERLPRVPLTSRRFPPHDALAARREQARARDGSGRLSASSADVGPQPLEVTSGSNPSA